jgi:hypothetical protein
VSVSFSFVEMVSRLRQSLEVSAGLVWAKSQLNDIFVPRFFGMPAYLVQVALPGGTLFHTLEYMHPLLGRRPYLGIVRLDVLLTPAIRANPANFAPVHC